MIAMRLHTIDGSPVRQRGWVGIIVILLALAIVAVLAKDALKSYGLAPGAVAKAKVGSPGERARMSSRL